MARSPLFFFVQYFPKRGIWTSGKNSGVFDFYSVHWINARAKLIVAINNNKPAKIPAKMPPKPFFCQNVKRPSSILLKSWLNIWKSWYNHVKIFCTLFGRFDAEFVNKPEFGLNSLNPWFIYVDKSCWNIGTVLNQCWKSLKNSSELLLKWQML